MRTLCFATLLFILAPPALADDDGRYGFDRGARAVVVEARRLDAAAGEIHRRLPARAGRSPVAHHARELAESARQFRRQAERGAPPARLKRVYDHVGTHYQRFERAMHQAHPRRGDHHDMRRGHGRHVHGAVRDFERAYHAAGSSLWRYARQQRDPRDRHARHDRHRRDNDDGLRHRYGPQRHLN